LLPATGGSGSRSMGATHTLESGLPVSAILLQHINYDNFNIPFSRTAMLDKQPLFAFPKLWDEFPDHQIKFIRNRFEFNAVLKNYYLKQLSDVPVCNRLLCPVCHLN
jgi:hypothetical protein